MASTTEKDHTSNLVQTTLQWIADAGIRDFQKIKSSIIPLDYTKYPQTIFRGWEVLPVLSW